MYMSTYTGDRRSFLEKTAGLVGTMLTPIRPQRDDTSETTTATALMTEVDAALTDLKMASPAYEVADRETETTAFAGTRHPIRRQLRRYIPESATQIESVFVQVQYSDRQPNEPTVIPMKMWLFFPPTTSLDTDRARGLLYDRVVDIATSPAESTDLGEAASRQVFDRNSGIDLVEKIPWPGEATTDLVEYHLRQIRATSVGTLVVESPWAGGDAEQFVQTEGATREMVEVLDRYASHQIIRPDTATVMQLDGGGN
jgi:hypothetical protein